MTKILLVIGSARPGRVADKVLAYIQKDISSRPDITATVADLKDIDLPFFNDEHIPSDPNYVQSNEKVKVWGNLVAAADAVLFITPEYNHTLSAIQKNAIDWLYAEWQDKPVTAVAYGWSGGSRSIATLRESLPVVKADVKVNMAELAFMKTINLDGTPIDEPAIMNKIAATIDEIV